MTPEEVWRRKTDEEVEAAAARFADCTEDAERLQVTQTRRLDTLQEGTSPHR